MITSKDFTNAVSNLVAPARVPLGADATPAAENHLNSLGGTAPALTPATM